MRSEKRWVLRHSQRARILEHESVHTPMPTPKQNNRPSACSTFVLGGGSRGFNAHEHVADALWPSLRATALAGGACFPHSNGLELLEVVGESLGRAASLKQRKSSVYSKGGIEGNEGERLMAHAGGARRDLKLQDAHSDSPHQRVNYSPVFLPGSLMTTGTPAQATRLPGGRKAIEETQTQWEQERCSCSYT